MISGPNALGPAPDDAAISGPATRSDLGPTAIAARGIYKNYGHVEALRGASLSVRPGEIVALVGDNGAGKSTLMKVMCGAVAPDAGEVWLGNQVRVKAGRFDSTQQEIGVVYQDLALAPHLSVLENIYLGHELLKGGVQRRLGALDRHSMATQADSALRRIGIHLPSVNVPVSLLSGGQRQAVAIARAVKWAQHVILLDEPTASLGAKQTQVVCGLIQAVAKQGLGVLMISHDIPSVAALADRIVVMRRGEAVAEFPAKTVTLSEIVGAMLGAEADSLSMNTPGGRT
ncbi:MAG TPA: ATP-binding cassette domain-containing protein [Acidimicrobiales bacterium]|nr:ATP-binding cassette domain-containing protein [Acidimicrobiales bacterium]